MNYSLLCRFIVYVNKRSNICLAVVTCLLPRHISLQCSILLKLLHAHEYYCCHGNNLIGCRLFIVASPAGDGDTEGGDGKEGRSTCAVHTGQTSYMQ